MHTDPIADMLTRIRNAAHAHHEVVTLPYSKIKENILKIMKEKGFVEDYEVAKDGKHPNLAVKIADNSSKLIFRRISKPGQRIYIKNQDLKSIKSGLGISIISTSKGIMSNLEAKKQNLGGELICEIY